MDETELTLQLLDAAWLKTYVANKIPARYRSALHPDDVLQDIHVAAVESVSDFVSIAKLATIPPSELCDRVEDRGIWTRPSLRCNCWTRLG